MKKINLVIISLVLAWLGTAAPAGAGEALYGFLFTTDLLPKGKYQYEQWMTWKFHKNDQGYFNLLEGRSELVYGVEDNLQVAGHVLYDWTQAYHNGPNGETSPPGPFSSDVPDPDAHYDAVRFVGFVTEVIWRLTSPYTEGVGIALYDAPDWGPGFVQNDFQIILQKNFLEDTMVWAINFRYAPEYHDVNNNDGTFTWQEESDFNADIGLSYRFIPDWSVGFEFLNEREFDNYDFSRPINIGYYLGPNVHYGGKDFYVTGFFAAQLPWSYMTPFSDDGSVVNGYNINDDFERYRIRIKAGIYL